MSFDRQLQDFVANPDNTNAFEALEEQLFIGGQWDELVEVYRTRLQATSVTSEPAVQAKLLFRLAQILEERCQDLEQAERTYWEVARLDPQCAPAVRQLRRLHQSRGQWDVVLQLSEVEAGLPMKPYERAESLVDIGRVWLDHMGEPTQALECFDKALELRTDHHDALAGRARTLEAMERTEEAAREWEKLAGLQRGPDRAPTLVAWARLLAEPLGDPDRAIEIYRRALTEDARNEAAVEALAVLAGKRGQWELVRDLFERRFDLASGARRRTGIALEAGHLYLERFNEPQMARIWFNRALELCPDDIGVHQSIAELERMAGNDGALASSLENVVELAGRTAPVSALLETANLRSERGEEEAALELLRLAHHRTPENPMVLEALSDSLSRLGHAEELAAVLDQRAALAADDPDEQVEALCELGRLHEEQLSDPSAAIDAYARAFALRPDAPDVAVRLERLYRKGEDWSRLREFLPRAIQTGPERDRLDFRCSQGELLSERFGDFDGAAIAFETVLDAEPGHPRALRGLESVARGSGDEEALLRVYQREAPVTTDRARMAFLARELMRALEARGRAIEAVPWLERWAQIAPEDREPLEVLARLYEAAGQAPEVVRSLERLDALLSGPEQASLRRRVAARQDDVAERARWLERALESHPGDVEALSALRDAYRELGRLEDQARVQRRLAESLPPDQKAHCLEDLARLLEEDLGDVDGAVVVLWRLHELPERPAAATEKLERILERVGRYEELAQLLMERRRSLAAESPESLELDLRRARLLLDHLGQAEQAAEVLRAVHQRQPAHREATEALERALRASNDSLALAALLDERARDESDPVAREQRELESATLLEEGGGSLERARETYERLTEEARDREVGRQASARLESMLERAGDWRALSARLEARLPGLSDAEALGLRERLAVLHRDRLGDREACIAHLEEVGRLAPERDGTWRSLGLLYRESGRKEDWARVVEAELATGPDRDRERTLRALAASLAREAGRLAQARDHFERLLALDPAHEEASEFLIEQYEREDRPADVVRLLDARLAGLASEPGTETAPLRLRIAGLRAGPLDDPAAAIAVLESGMPDAEREALMAEPLSDLYQRTGRTDDLVALCRRRADRCEDPGERASWLMRLGDALRERGDLDGASEAYRGVVEARPGDRDAASVLRAIAREQGDTGTLAGLLRLQLDPASGDDPLPVMIELAGLLAGPLDQPDEALSLYQRALGISPHHAEAFRAAVELGERLDRHEELLALVDERLGTHLPPTDRAVLLARRGELLAGPLARPDEAAPAFREALAIDPGLRAAHRGLRAVLEQLGRWSAVLDCLFVEAGEAEAAERESIYESALVIAGERLHRDATLPWLERLRRLRPEDPSVVSRIADVHRQAGRPEALLRAIEDELALASGDRRRELWLERARVLERDLDSPGRAVGALEEAREEFEDDLLLVDELARLYGVTGRTRERTTLLESRLDSAGDGAGSAGDYRELAELWENELGEPERAVAHRLRALAATPESDAAWIERVTELRELLASTGRKEAWTRAAQTELDARRARDANDPHVATLREALARTCDEELGRPRAGLAHWRALADGEAIAADQRRRAEAALLDGLRRGQQWVELEARLTARLEATTGEGAEPAADDWMELALLREERLHQPAAAARAYERVIQADATRLAAWRGLHRTCERLGDWSRVVRALEQEAALTGAASTPSGAPLWRRVGDLAWHRLGETDRAHDAYARALEADPEDLGALRSLSSLAERRDDWQAELEHSERELEVLGERDPERRADLWLRVGRLARDRAGEAGRALAAFESADAARTLTGTAMREWAELYREQGRMDRFARVFGAWCDEARSAAGPADHLMLSDALLAEGREGDALDRALRAGEIAPERPEVWHRVAALLEQSGERRAASEAEERAADHEGPAEAAATLCRAAERVASFDPAWAVERLRRATELDPAQARAQAARASAALALDSFEEAESAAAAALDAADADAALSPVERRGAARVGGQAAARRGRIESAARFFDAALGLAPDDREALVGLGEALFVLGDEPRAREIFERLDALDPGRLGARHLAMIGSVLERDGDASSALERFEAALTLDRAQPDAHAGRVRVRECEGDVDGALDALKAWAECTADDARRADLWLRRARLADTGDRLEIALASWTAATDAWPASAAAWAEWAERLWTAERAEEALDVARRGRSELDDDAACARLAWVEGCALEALGRPDEAIEAHAEGVKRDPRATRAALAAARLCRSAGDWENASRHLEAFALGHPDSGHPDLARVWVERARLLSGPLEEVDEALRCYERALAIDPDDVEALEPTARLLEHVPEREADAVDLHTRLLALDPARSRSIRALARIAERRGDDPGRDAGLALLCALGAASPAESDQVDGGFPIRLADIPTLSDDVGESVRRLVQETGREIADALGQPAERETPEGRSEEEIAFRVALQEEEDQLGAPGLAGLSDEELGRMLVRVAAAVLAPRSAPADDALGSALERKLGLWSRRRLRRVLDGVSLEAVEAIDPARWRAELAELAAEAALDRTGGDLRTALLALALADDEPLPAESADLSDLVRRSDPARTLLHQATAAWCERLRPARSR